MESIFKWPKNLCTKNGFTFFFNNFCRKVMTKTIDDISFFLKTTDS